MPRQIQRVQLLLKFSCQAGATHPFSRRGGVGRSRIDEGQKGPLAERKKSTIRFVRIGG